MKANFFCDIGNIILNLIYPPVCCFCGTRLSPLNRIFVCDECANSLPYCRRANRCTHCGKPIAEGSLCSHCSLTKSNLKGMTAPFVYDGCAKSAVIAFKREQNAMNAKTLSLYVSEMIKYDFGGVEFDCVVSAPPRKDRMKSENTTRRHSSPVTLHGGFLCRILRIFFVKKKKRKSKAPCQRTNGSIMCSASLPRSVRIA